MDGLLNLNKFLAYLKNSIAWMKPCLSDTGGAGLGLSIAEEIIRLHGVTITAFSENEMVSFVIMLPISD